MPKIVHLEAYRSALNRKIRELLEITGFDILDKDHLEVVIDDGGEIKVLQLCRDLVNADKWSCTCKKLEQIIEEVLNEDPDNNADQ